MISQTLERAGVSIYYEDHSPADTSGRQQPSMPLLLTHGYSSNSEAWRKNLPALTATRRVIAWDVRGHGRTDVPPDPAYFTQEACVGDMEALLDACEVEAAAVGGLSLGGYLSLAFHLAHAERVAGLLLFDTGPGYKSETARATWNSYAESRARDFEQQGLDALSASPEVAGGLHDPAGLALAARGILVQHDASVIESLASVAVPTLVVVGEDDKPFIAAAEYMAAHIPGASKKVIAGAGHASNIDQPALFNAVVSSFLASEVDSLAR
jgi:pimeloyl-ACP methyl ester carboxylesterase